ncbi:hypothetical protein [Halomonas sp. DN3]|uniref:phage head spike fiber domain-containing protein n=1 Tax=Halomonas sp. DN3 TaxID=2953657 RepID=UPI0020A20E20|nr:hypothetical protein [Halomonas sp. DN3]USZ48146.1 hypothetical protein NKF27_11455 [Halomonas sp. DN3]
MADLDPALQDSIDNLQTRHTALVDAVRNYTGGSIAGATNDLLAARDDVLTTVDKRETALLGLIQRDTDKPVPSLLSDFKTQTYMLGTRRLEHGVSVDDMFTAERSSPKFVPGPQGTLVEVPPDTVAYHYDPETGEALGALIEGGATNLLPYSIDFTTWTLFSATVDSSGQASPDGLGEATLYTISASSGGFFESIAVPTSSSSYVISYFVKKTDVTARLQIRDSSESGNTATSEINATTGEVVFIGDYGTYSNARADVKDCGDFWRVYLSATIGQSTNIRAYVYAGGASGTGVTVWGAQLEEGTTPTSYIPTDGAPVTRGADRVLRMVNSELNPSSWSLLVELNPEWANSGDKVFYYQSSGIKLEILARGNTNTGFQFRLGSSSNGDLVNSPVDAIYGTKNRVAVSASANGDGTYTLIISSGGQSRSVQCPDDLQSPGNKTLAIGSNSFFLQIVASYSNVQLFPRALSAAELEALTA